MNRNIVFGAVGLSSLLVSGCSADALPTAVATASPAAIYFAGDYRCTVSGGSGFEVDDLIPGGEYDWSYGGELNIGADGSWRTPTSNGTWLLRGNTLTLTMGGDSKSTSVDIPGFPDTAPAASAGSTLVIAHPTYTGDETLIRARMNGGGFQLINEDQAILDCARS